MKTYNINELVEGVEYEISDGILKLKYRKKEGKLQIEIISNDVWEYSTSTYNDLVGLEFIECDFNPEKGNVYFFPSITRDAAIDFEHWTVSAFDMNIKKRVGVYRTKEQALEKARDLGWLQND